MTANTKDRVFAAFERIELDTDGNASIALNPDDIEAIVTALEIAAVQCNESLDAEPEVFSPSYRSRARWILSQIGVSE